MKITSEKNYPAIMCKLLSIFLLGFLSETGLCAGIKVASSDTLTPLISYKHYGEEDGLHCKTVYEVIQDKEGFLWFATDAGSFRFDGKIFKQYNIENGVTDKEVLKIFQDSYGRIWFLTLNGYLSFWKDGKIYNPSNTSFLKKAYAGGSLFSYFEDSKKRIWFGTSEFVFVIIDGDSVRQIKSPYTGYLGGINIHEDKDGNIWAFNVDKMFRLFNDRPGDTIQFPKQVYIACHRKKQHNEMFFQAFQRNVYKLTDETLSLYADSSAIPYDSKIVNMVADEDNLWFCTQGNGCIKMVNGKFAGRYLPNVAITSIYRDRENNLWFNTMGEGVYMLPYSSDFITNYNVQSGFSSDAITSFLLDGKDSFWLGYKSGVVDKVENNLVKTFKLNVTGDPSFNRVNSLVKNSDFVFCGTDIGVYYIHNNKIGFALIKKTPKDIHYPVKQVYVSNEKDVYVAHSGGLIRLIKNGEDYFADILIKRQVRTTAITQYPDSRFLISITVGLKEYIPDGNLESYTGDVDFSSTRILDMKRIPAGLLALATNGSGIYFLQGKKLYQHLTTSNGLSDNNCKRIFVSDSNLYVATDKGLNILVKVKDQWTVENIITSKNGLLSNTVNDVAERNGVIYIATEKGLSLLNKTKAFRSGFQGRVHATELLTDSVKTVSDTVYNFKANIPRLLIRFAYPVFDPVNELKIKYRLLHSKTDNPEWINSSGSNEVELSSLNPGQYIFQLKPDAPSITNAGITNLYINIIPLWWQTTLARIAFALVLIAFITLIIRWRTQLQYKKQFEQLKLLEAERTRIASDMHDDIGADLTQISIWSNILESSKNKDINVLPRLTKSSNEVLQKMEQIIWALNSVHSHAADLVSYLREYALQYLESTGIRLQFEADEAMPDMELSAILKRNVFLTVKELLHNTVKHSGASNVSIKIYHSGSFLYIDYADDGKGFTPKPKEDGMGNITVQKRMQEIDSIISIKTSPGAGFSAQLKITLTNNSLKTNKQNKII